MSMIDWEKRHPVAAAELRALLGAVPWPVVPKKGDGRSEAWAQQQVRMSVAEQGAMAWRNNVGATPAKCPHCGTKQQPIRYGLANDSSELNEVIKSHDLILAIPRKIQHSDVGKVIAQFGSIETKRPGWVYSGTPEEQGQLAWATLISQLGGFTAFSTGEIDL